MPPSTKAILGEEASAQLRDQLIGELEALIDPDDGALWAHRTLAKKNQLTTADALAVEDAFRRKIAGFSAGADAHAGGGQEKPRRKSRPGAVVKRSRSQAVDKSTLPFHEPRRVRDREHVRFVAQHPCLVCGRQPADAHHLRFTQSRAFGRKVSDEFTVPLCRGHHREVHRVGDEAAWWQKAGIDSIAKARELWIETHPLPQPEIAALNQLKQQNEPNLASRHQ